MGAELARLCARDGHAVVLVARRVERLEQLKAELEREQGARVHVIPADLADPAAPAELVRRLDGAGLTVDVLVNSAGFGAFGPLATADPDMMARMIRVNVEALTGLTRLLLPGMVSRSRGRILNVASTAGFVPGPLMSVYYATKAYVISFSEALAEELRGTGVTVTVLCPGFTPTEFQAVARLDARRVSRLPGVMNAPAVARAGYAGLMRGKRMVVPGIVNRVLPVVIRFSPRGMVARVSRFLQERVRG